ncbi:MAG: hypothetical protein GY759_05705 [Chloroflexi bacterium]|nr:hypothetical protein [Chloroflexota bacterium]
MAFDPLSSTGIAKAMRSGITAAAVISRALQGDSDAVAEYASEVVSEFDSYLQNRYSYHRIDEVAR